MMDFFNFSIREAQILDAEALSELGKSTFLHTYLPKVNETEMADMMLYADETFKLSHIIQHFSQPHITYCVAESAGKLIGYVKLVRHHSPPQLENKKTIQLEKIYVKEAQKGKSIGKKLLEKSLEIAQKEGFEAIWLCVWEINQSAVNFYTKFGFEQDGFYPFVMGNSVDMDLLMVKHL